MYEKMTCGKMEYCSILDWWDATKEAIKRLLRSFAHHKHQVRRAVMAAYQQDLDNLMQVVEEMRDPQEVKRLTKLLKEDEDQRLLFQVRVSNIHDAEEGEKPTRYFFQNIKRRQEQTTIESLLTSTGEEIRGKDRIVKEVEGFYSNLWTTRTPVDNDQQDQYLNVMDGEGISEEESNTIKDPASEEDIREVIRGMANNKSPGLDGLSKEFYTSFWSYIKGDLTEVVNAVLLFGKLPESARTARVKLLYKKGDQRQLKNWRPISNLNVDYKIVSKLLTNRIKGTITSVISDTQKCSVPGRNISDILLNIQAALSFAKLKKIPILVASFDQENAFDTVNHEFMLKVLQKVGMGHRTLALIEDMYSNMLSRVEINGHLSNNIRINRGIRQGCPLSMLLYAIQSEAFARHVQLNNNIKGFRIGRCEQKLQQYADDNTLITSTAGSVTAMIGEFDLLRQVTGQRINEEKTLIMCLGDELKQQLMSSPQSSRVRDTIKILGQHYGHNSANLTWEEKLSKVHAVLNCYKARQLTWIGRINILNSLAMSLIIYNARIIKIRKDMARKFSTALHRFLWFPETIEGIRRKKLHASKSNGGIGMFNIFSKLEACRLEKFRSLARLEEPTDLWHEEALFHLASRILDVNPALYSPGRLHSRIPSKAWKDDLELHRSTGLDIGQWKEASFRDLYQKRSALDAQETTLYTLRGEAISWDKVLLHQKHLHRYYSNEERVTSYRVAHEGFVYGHKRSEYGLLLTKQGEAVVLSCKFCGAVGETSHHLYHDCPFTGLAIKNLEDDIEKITKRITPITRDVMLYNQLDLKEDLITIKGCNILKVQLRKLKSQHDIDNKALDFPDRAREILRRKTNRELRKTLEMWPVLSSTVETATGQRIDWGEVIT